MKLEDKLEKLKNYFRDRRVMIAFSGGADSTLLAKIAQEYSEDALAVTVDNGVMPTGFTTIAREIAEKVGIQQLVVEKNLLNNPDFASNPPNRCYICKKSIHGSIGEIFQESGFDFVADGTNLSDLLEDRPGVMVNYEKNIKMPLVELGITAEEVRKALKDMGVSYSPSTTCLATRLPSGSFLTMKRLNRIKYAENLLKNFAGTEVLRVRDEDGTAVIEVDYTRLLDSQTLSYIDSELKAVGFRKVTLNLDGYHHHEKDMIIYKPCKDDKNRIMFETELPYLLDLEKSCEGLKQLGKVKCSLDMGVAIMEAEGKNVTLFSKGKIVARGVKDRDDADNFLSRVLPLIRRKL
jgi:pyridinium-3,5-biscarboxylic acid mononucleotide sulfurtransferase